MGLIGAALSGVGAIFGGISASKAMKKYKNNLEAQRSKNDDWYHRRYNEDATQRASAQAVLTRVEDSIRRRNRAAAGVQAVMGGTEDSVAAAKGANAQATASAASAIAVNGEARKDTIEAQAQQNEANIQGQLNRLEVDRARNISEAIKGVTSAAGQMDFEEVGYGLKKDSSGNPILDENGNKQYNHTISL